jgi:FkbM family methyltransferase
MTAKDVTEAHVYLQMYSGYTDIDLGILSEFLNSERKPEPGFVVDFLGTKIRATSLWKEARELHGQVLGLPIPGDFHAEAVEWIGLLKAVRSATDRYVAMELGAGFGPWAIAGAVAARRRNIRDIRLTAVEGDSAHYRSLRQHFIDNGFNPDQHRLLEAAVGAVGGVADWPVLDDATASEVWGSRPVIDKCCYTGEVPQLTKQIRVISMRDLVTQEVRWDLIHIDVQGHEFEICRSCVDALNERAHWLVIGTHSRKIEGDLLELFYRAGWQLEHEKPAKFAVQPNPASLEAMTTLDGTQVWRNPRCD